MACECNDINTRASHTHKVKMPECRTNVIKKSFIYWGSSVWNDLPANIHESASCDVFLTSCQKCVLLIVLTIVFIVNFTLTGPHEKLFYRLCNPDKICF